MRRDKEQKEKKKPSRSKNKQTVSDPKYYQPSPIYIPSYKEDVQTLVNNLVPEPTPKEEKDIDTSRWTKTKDKPAGEDKEDISKEQKGEKKEEETKAEEHYLEDSDSDLIY